jgi:citrate lyase subunit beta / citryl-CoA lyase
VTWRALLYVPAHVPRFVAKAADRGADAIILDLEDGVPEEAKERARVALAAAVPQAARGGASVLVRIDGTWRRAWRDLEAAVAAGADGVVVPKVADGGAIRVLSAFLDELEREHGRAVGGTSLLAVIESARGLLAAREVAACPRVAALIPGNEDLALDMGVEGDAELFVATHATLLVAARAEGKVVVGSVGSGAGFGDLEGFRTAAQRARSFGFTGVTCIHPSQVPIVHEVFTPSEDEIEHAERVVAAYDAAGGGAVAVEGAMVDRPVAERARALLRRAPGRRAT